MPEHQTATEHDVANASFIRHVRIVAVTGALVGAVGVIALLSGWFDPRVDSRWKLPVQTFLIFASPVFLFLLMPAAAYSIWGGLRGAKVAVWFLILALIALVVILAAPLVRPLFT